MFMVAIFFVSFLGGSFFIDNFSENVPGYDVYSMQAAEEVSSKLTSFLLQLSLVLPLLLLLIKKIITSNPQPPSKNDIELKEKEATQKKRLKEVKIATRRHKIPLPHNAT